MAEELLINVNIEGERELDKVTSKVEKLGKTGNKTQTELQKLRNELKEQKNAMLQAEEGSEEYGRALQRASQIQQRMTDISKQIRAGMMGVGEVMANVSRTASGMAGGFGALTGAAQLFGVENEAVINSIARLQSIMSVASGLAQFADSIDALQELMGALRASTAMSQGGMEGMSQSAEKTSQSLGKVGDTLKENSANMVRSGAEIQALGSKIQSVTRSSGIDIEAVMKKYSHLSEENQRMIREGLEGTIRTNAENTAQLSHNTRTQVTGFQKVITSIKGMGSALGGILKSLGPMLAITAAVAALSYAFEKLIEWINKVPPEVELKLKLEESIYDDYKKELEKVSRFQLDLNNAVTKEQKKQLDEIAKKEFNLTDERLEQIKKTTNGWKLFFKEYLELAKNTYYNEALLKQRVDEVIQSQSAASRRGIVLEGIQGLMKEAGFSEEQIKSTVADITSGKRVTRGLQIDAQIREWRRLNDEVIKHRDNLTALQKIPFKNIGNTLLSGDGNAPGGPKVVGPVKVFEQQSNPDYLKNLLDTITEQFVEEIEKSGKTSVELWSKILELSPKDQEDLAAVLAPLTVSLVDKIAQEVDGSNVTKGWSDSFRKQLELYQSYANSLGGITDGIAGIFDARMTMVDNYYDQEENRINGLLISEQEKNSQLEKLDQERYEKQKKLLEAQKAFRIATVGMDLASGLMGIYTRATLPVAAGGLPSPANWISAGLEAAALTAQSIASIQQIRAQQIQAPSISNNGSSGVSIAALSPNKTSLTSREDNLNESIRNAIKQEMNNTYEVKVTEINEVQDRVRVRDRNSSY